MLIPNLDNSALAPVVTGGGDGDLVMFESLIWAILTVEGKFGL